ncbi:unnamed protein product [Ambrosiozyma monospora]|uniref:Unnamed protein product n=1 Tax=Ambrosiozyma monospora TaxID=43982 RepID=A0A9W7DDB7_AMBMO|nr:unnamed protein product [Ambrosiozyma monospora]
MEKQYHNATLNQVNDTTGLPFLYNPVKVSSTYVRHYESSYAHFIGNFEVSITYVDMVCMFWILILASLAITSHFPSVFKSSRFTITNKLRGWLTLPTVLGTHFEPWNLFGYNISSHLPLLKVFDTLLPTLQEFMILCVYFVLLYVVVSYDYATTESSSFLGSAIQQKRRFKADRTGLLAFAQLPPLFLFGGRNNILIKFTGLPFSSFIIFHKWIGRVMVFLALVHALQFVDFYKASDGLEAIRQLELWHYGVKAYHFGALLLIQGIFILRRKWYEVFLLLHIAFALIFIYAAYMHCKDVGFLSWVYASGAVWLLDRVWRLVSIFYINGGTLNNKATFTMINDCVRVTIPKPKRFHGFPGCYIHMYVFDHRVSWKPWENHPFTVYCTDTEIRIYIKSKTGFTANLHNLLSQIPEGHELQLRVGIEGPYGHAVNVSSYDKVILLAGGNGVPGPYYHTMNCLKQLDKLGQSEKLPELEFVWINQTSANLKWFEQELNELSVLDREGKVNKLLYLTREKNRVQSQTQITAAIYASTSGDVNLASLTLTKKSNIRANSTNSVEDATELATYTTPLLQKQHSFASLSTTVTPTATPPLQTAASSSSSSSSSTNPLTTTDYQSIPRLESHPTSLSTSSPPSFKDYKIIKERPNLYEFLSSEFSRNGRTVVLTCGSGVMCDSIRDSVSKLVRSQGKKDVDQGNGNGKTGFVDLVEELQVWA